MPANDPFIAELFLQLVGDSNEDSSGGLGIIGSIQIKAAEYEQRKKNRPNIERMSQDEIKALRKTDPFMYYSLPAVRKAALALEPVDCPTAIDSSDCKEQQRRDALKRLRRSAYRRTRLSFEVHPSVLLDDDFLNQL